MGPRPKPSAEEVLACALIDDARRGVSVALDRIFAYAQEQFSNERFGAVDAVLQGIPMHAVSGELLVGMLVATLPARERLHSRAAFVTRVQQRLEELGTEDVNGVLEGLR